MKSLFFSAFKWGLHTLLFFLCGVLLLQSCSSDDSTSPTEMSRGVMNRSTIGEQSSTIDEATAQLIAHKLMNTPVDGKSFSQPRNITNTIVITNRYDEPVMYAVNFESDGGYIVVSASKKTSPIIVSSYKGSYENSKQTSTFINRLIANASAKITESFDYPTDSMDVYTTQWSVLIPPKKHVKSQATYSSSYQTIVDEAISEWESQGLEVYEAKKWLNNEYNSCQYLPDLDKILAKFNMPVNWADGKPMNELSFIVVRHTLTYITSDDKCDHITTKWNVSAPYNAAVPNGKPLSSEAVALGKILYHFKDASIFDFSSSASNPLQNNAEVANFLYDVALNTYTVFGSTYSYSTYSDLQYALSNHYHYSFNHGELTQNGLINSIDNGSPTIIIEYDKDDRSHAWVCDGYRVVDDRIDFYLMVPVGQPEDIFGPYEASAQWDANGTPNFQFNNSDDYIYFNAFFDPDQLRASRPVYVSDFIMKIRNN